MGELMQFPDPSEGQSRRRRAPKLGRVLTLSDLAESWKLSLAEAVSEATVKLYVGAVDELVAYMTRHSLPPVLSEVTTATVEGCLREIRERTSSSTADTRRRGLVQFFRWAVEIEDLLASDDNPMKKVRPRKIVEKVIEPLPDEVIRALLKDTSSKTFRDIRDRAFIRMFLDSGGRLSEIANLNVDDVDERLGLARVLGKGGRERDLPLGRKARIELDRYLRVRAAHEHAEDSALWLGLKGSLTPSGVYQALKKRAKRLGYDVHPHQFRHTFSHHFLANGGNEHALAHLNGWTSTQMVQRYARSTQAQRAREEHRKLSPGDRF